MDFELNPFETRLTLGYIQMQNIKVHNHVFASLESNHPPGWSKWYLQELDFLYKAPPMDILSKLNFGDKSHGNFA